jgi:hypothetical protein
LLYRFFNFLIGLIPPGKVEIDDVFECPECNEGNKSKTENFRGQIPIAHTVDKVDFTCIHKGENDKKDEKLV